MYNKIVLILLLPTLIYAKGLTFVPAPYKIEWDINFSPYAGGEDVLFAHRGIEWLEAYFLANVALRTSKSASARLGRLSELITVWMPLNFLAVVTQHEIFGHGYRIRDIDHGRVEVTGYEIDVPPPYGPGGGATMYRINQNLTTTQDSAIAIAGVESTAILALITKLKWLDCGKIDPKQSLLYILSQQDLNLYIGTLKTQGDLSGHDIHGYRLSLNQTYPDHLLNKGRLRSLSWINLADAFTFYAAYSWFRYLDSGKETAIPMIASYYLPGLRLGLTPFGPELFFENFFLYKKHPVYAYAKEGHHADNGYYGLGFYFPQFYSIDKWSFGARFDLWRQPKLLLEPGAIPITEIDFDETPTTKNPLYPSTARHAMRCGVAASAIFFWKGNGTCGAEGEFGFKTPGFLPGYSLVASPTIRLAFVITY